MERRLALIGFGEAARAFAPSLDATLTAYDRLTDNPDARADMLDDMAVAGVRACETPDAALAGTEAVLSLVTADQALTAAERAEGLDPGAYWFDLNSVAPGTKRAAAVAIAARGGHYVDVAVMAPVLPLRAGVPLLLAGPDAASGATLLRAIGFRDVTVIGASVGDAAAVKMIRSVMIKGIEALSAECAIAADAAEVRAAVIASLDASWPGADWGRRFDYNLERMTAHGTRRAAEMAEVVETLDALGVDAAMSRATAAWQREIGMNGVPAPAGKALAA